ncbi:hypothetical protein MLP_32950 [Microlunatus phosphovorus NM-1]|uniref:Uncharacterized protein n=1 Tax=Microlunatus phosphovorus (strain ATCC 700054 / DSM 10555 / JCM 9379 / NBRC 101784 / NCIMB 13414 / VKM Ac-1990 / NM-1) TaxID=1032480 RepID=F5XM52_MICPN|nr:hypothetical protein MLP_32950 [Microlunatus phosphovorus NM-1]
MLAQLRAADCRISHLPLTVPRPDAVKAAPDVGRIIQLRRLRLSAEVRASEPRLASSQPERRSR